MNDSVINIYVIQLFIIILGIQLFITVKEIIFMCTTTNPADFLNIFIIIVMNPEQVDKTVSSDDATSIWRQFKVVGVEDDASIASTSSCFFDWEHIYPQLKLLLENIDIIKQEAKSIPKVN